MEVILTESQIKEFVIIEGVKNVLEESVLLNESLDVIKSQIRNAIIAGIACTSIIAGIATSKYFDNAQKRELINYVEQNDVYSTTQKELHDEKVKALERCMRDKYLKLKGPKSYNPKDILLSAEEMVSACEEHDYDLVLAAAQAWYESAWGTTPRAKKTNSVFSVGSYDNGKNTAIYNDVNASIRPYIKLMKNDYNIDTNTINSIFSGKQSLVNYDGNRYASNKAYEKNLAATYYSILKSYPVLSWDVETYLKNKEGI